MQNFRLTAFLLHMAIFFLTRSCITFASSLLHYMFVCASVMGCKFKCVGDKGVLSGVSMYAPVSMCMGLNFVGAGGVDNPGHKCGWMSRQLFLDYE